jgi:hypothetical protein
VAWFGASAENSPGGEVIFRRNPPAFNLPLAARPCVGHIGLTGDVAEWLKAAVC